MYATPHPHARKAQIAGWTNFVCTMMQLACSVAIILIIRYDLQYTVRQQTSDEYITRNGCLLAGPDWPGACYYAYVVASTSILVCFLMSLMQCLTVDCCGLGRIAEVVFDLLAIAWWLVAGIVLAAAARKANVLGVPSASYRAAVVALCWASVVFFCLLLLTNAYIILRVGRSYATSQPIIQGRPTNGTPYGGPQAVQMAAMPAGQVYSVPSTGMPVGYPVLPPPGTGYPPGQPGFYPPGQYPGYPVEAVPPGQQGGYYPQQPPFPQHQQQQQYVGGYYGPPGLGQHQPGLQQQQQQPIFQGPQPSQQPVHETARY